MTSLKQGLEKLGGLRAGAPPLRGEGYSQSFGNGESVCVRAGVCVYTGISLYK